mmetsp:Transcript_13290/g.18830  ORF Transcript_13290/g.18830 Transcript_13290/m.18830 type:complete len:81 (+) Transcript_13290:280-522(+)
MVLLTDTAFQMGMMLLLAKALSKATELLWATKFRLPFSSMNHYGCNEISREEDIRVAQAQRLTVPWFKTKALLFENTRQS